VVLFYVQNSLVFGSFLPLEAHLLHLNKVQTMFFKISTGPLFVTLKFLAISKFSKKLTNILQEKRSIFLFW
jgi:hypothetical protein